VARPQSRYVCQACGNRHLRWEGQCRGCGAWDTLVETLAPAAPGRAARRGPAAHEPVAPRALASLITIDIERRPTGLDEFDRVLGGGLVPGSVVLVGGEPGIGKSTLVLEAAAGIAAAGIAAAAGSTAMSVLYASGEESAGQLRLRAQRLGLLEGPAGAAVSVLAETDVERIVEAARQAAPRLLVVDSVQTITHDGLDGPAGSLGQVREAAARLADFAKSTGTPVLIVGHVTKDGSLAGPKALEHLVDVVLALEGDRYGPLRLLRASKNRFGSTEEVGVFEMVGSGLAEVSDPARAFLTEGAAAAPGSVVAATLEGSRPLLVEVQALVAPASAGNPRRTVGGLDPNRLALLVAVLGRRAGIAIAGHDLYASLVGGVTVAEPALDLPLALALTSSHRDRAVESGTVACGEVGLLGELRPVAGLERRLREAARLGFTRAILPAGSGRDLPPAVSGLEVVAVGTLREALAAGLGL
jgi:DNA repair protein RadA/Sms